MKKYIAALSAIAGLLNAAPYEVTKEVTVTTTQVVTVTATTFVVERFSAIVDREAPLFLISGSYRDAEGTVIERKTIRVTMEQASQMMGNLEQIMSDAKAAVEANIQNLLAE